MDNELAYEILKLMRDENLHSHTEVDTRLRELPKFINITASETIAVWRILKSNECIIDALAFGDIEYMKKFPSTKKEQTYEVLNPKRNCIATYKKLASQQRKRKITEGRKDWKERNWLIIGILGIILGSLLTLLIEAGFNRLKELNKPNATKDSINLTR